MLRGLANAIRIVLPHEDLWGLVLAGRPTDGIPEGYKLFRCSGRILIGAWHRGLRRSAKLCGEVSLASHPISTTTLPNSSAPRMPHPSVISIHDAIPILFPQGISRNEKLIFLAGYWGLHSANLIITGSHNSQNDLGRIFHLPSKRFAITLYGISEEFKPLADPLEL